MSKTKVNYYEEKLYYSLTYKDMVRIFELIDDYKYTNLNIELGDLKLQIDKSGIGGSKEEDDNQVVSSSSNKEEQKVKSNIEIESDVDQTDTENGLDDIKEKDNNERNMTEKDGDIPVKTSITGVFYAAPSPEEGPFVDVGSKVSKGDELGLIEVMKLFNSINAPCDGIIKEIRVENEGVVNVDDVLMVIEPT